MVLLNSVVSAETVVVAAAMLFALTKEAVVVSAAVLKIVLYLKIFIKIMHYANHTNIHIHKNYLSVTKAGLSCVATRSQCKRTTNARIEPSSILVFGRTFTLTYGCNARYSEPSLTLINIKITSLKHINGSMNTICIFYNKQSEDKHMQIILIINTTE